MCNLKHYLGNSLLKFNKNVLISLLIETKKSINVNPKEF